MKTIISFLISIFISCSADDQVYEVRKTEIRLQNSSGKVVRINAFNNEVLVKENTINNSEFLLFENNWFYSNLPYGKSLEDPFDLIVVIFDDEKFFSIKLPNDFSPEIGYFNLNRNLTILGDAYIKNDTTIESYTYTFVPEDYDNALPCTPEICD